MSNPLKIFRVRQSAPATTQEDVSTTATGPDHQVFAPRLIGSDLEALRNELLVCGNELRTTALFRGISSIGDMLHLLARLTCRIAIVGQVKAGKSSLINALVRRPDLLPTDVNPWTTAVTHLHFGRVDAPANVAAEFTFFDTNEWEHLAKGGGYIRELTQRLVPGFEAELLEKHIDAMRRQSEERLGPALGELLGKRHVFPTLSTEILERYVCSGVAGLLGMGPEQKGFYSDVVKCADLYFNGNDFSFPTTIIDTPGTNDPFLVRDEITRRALETADIYVVVLTARQALSAADVALLRILRGLNKERIAVFINRIDELPDLMRDTPMIVQHVRAGLQREFPASEIPIVAGSALWARTAIFGSAGEIDQMLSEKMKSYAAYLSQQAGTSIVANALKDQGAQVLLLSSGLPALLHFLADLTLRCHTAHVLKQILRSFSELVEVGQNAVRHETEILGREEELNVNRQQLGQEELQTIDAEVSENERLTVALQGLLIDLQSRTDQAIEERCKKILENLRDAVQGFSDMECETLRQAIAAGQRGHVWKCQTAGLRQAIEERFIDSYREARQEISALEANIFPLLKQLLSRHYPQWKQPVEDTAESAELPSLGALSQVVALDLEEPWWKRWWTSLRGADERTAEIDRLIKHEFYPIAEDLALSARTHLKAQQSSTLQRATLVYMGLVEVLQEQSRARRARTRVLMSAGNGPRRIEMRRNSEARAAELKQQFVSMGLLARRLENIDRTWGEKIG